METLTWPQILAWRMERQFLLTPEPDPAVVARRLAGVQAQVASAAATSLAVRGAYTGDAVGVSLVKTWAMRGTLHLLPVEEASAYLTLCSTVRNWEKPAWTRASGATPADVEAIAKVAADVLPSGPLTRAEFTAAVLAETGSTHLEGALSSGWGSILKPLAWWGVLCHGPSQGGRITFTSPASLPGWRPAPPVEEAARTVLRAYLGAHGPATPDMFDNWLMRRMSRKGDVRSWFAALEDELTEVSVEGVVMRALTGHVEALTAAEPSGAVRLLGPFDQYVLGAGTDATYLIPAEHRAKVSRAAGWISPVVLHGGAVAGTWDPATGESELWSRVPGLALRAEVRSFPV
ncbi:winged helix DNA-binding domain-containing protein [Actinocorallia longicatena]|uniref:Winged helix DNA-binding domain-containing protein n=1 Tax=Actinocorallia longicatena TaxID=111803 RepID=A0ABP6QHS8_9ACTN